MNLNEVGWPEVWALQLSRGHTKVEKPESPDDPFCAEDGFLWPSCHLASTMVYSMEFGRDYI